MKRAALRVLAVPVYMVIGVITICAVGGTLAIAVHVVVHAVEDAGLTDLAVAILMAAMALPFAWVCCVLGAGICRWVYRLVTKRSAG